MRPVDRGHKPAGLVIKKYQDAWFPLKIALGEYCSYCEKPLTDVIEIEHVKPKKAFPALKNDWNNLLVGCKFCNSTKGNRPADDAANYLWPHVDNPLLYIAYNPAALPAPRPGLHPTDLQRVNNTLKLTGLDKQAVPSTKGHDNRGSKRDEVWINAQSTKDEIDLDPALVQDQRYMRLLKLVIKATGFFSVWWTVFDGYPQVRLVILGLFPGTRSSAFDANGNAR